LLLPVVRFTPAFEPMAILDEPVIFLARALVPVTVLSCPVVTNLSRRDKEESDC